MPDYYGQAALTPGVVEEMMREYTGTNGTMHRWMHQWVSDVVTSWDQVYDPTDPVPVINIPRTCTFTVSAAGFNNQLWELLTSDGTDEPEPEPDPEPCTETELTDFLGI